MPTKTQATTPAAQALIAAALTPLCGAPVAPRAPKAKAVAKLVVPTAYAPGPKGNPCRKGTWGNYMVAVTLKASTPAAATKLHATKARRAGYNPAKPLDFKWMLAKGIIVAA